jgi:hypothetical protein
MMADSWLCPMDVCSMGSKNKTCTMQLINCVCAALLTCCAAGWMAAFLASSIATLGVLSHTGMHVARWVARCSAVG